MTMKLEDLLTRNLWARVKSPLSQSKQNGCILSMIVVEAVHLYHLKFEGSERGGKIHVTTYVDFVRA